MSLITLATRSWLTRSIKPFVFTDEFDCTLDYTNTDNLGLYIHIPFCRSLCGFCPYCKVVYNKNTADSYTEALIKEIEIVGNAALPNKKEVTSLYFGGGTPALLAERINEIVNKINQYFIITEGIGLELHPDDVTSEKLKKLKAAGVTKISIGIQSFQPEYLSLLGREALNVDEMCKALTEVGFETVSMDFIFALPGQTKELLIKDIETAFANGANHIAIYPFIDFILQSVRSIKFPNMKRKSFYMK